MCFGFLYSLCLIVRTEREITINLYMSLCKVSVIFVRFWCQFNFLDRFSKLKNQFEIKNQFETQKSNLMKTRPVVADLFHAGGRTDG
jgi:hypothetical protein